MSKLLSKIPAWLFFIPRLFFLIGLIASCFASEAALIEWKLSGHIIPEISSARSDSTSFIETDFHAGDSFVFEALFDTEMGEYYPSGPETSYLGYLSSFRLATEGGVEIEAPNRGSPDTAFRHLLEHGFLMNSSSAGIHSISGDINDLEFRGLFISGNAQPSYIGHLPPEEFLLHVQPTNLSLGFFDSSLEDPYDAVGFNVSNSRIQLVTSSGSTSFFGILSFFILAFIFRSKGLSRLS